MRAGVLRMMGRVIRRVILLLLVAVLVGCGVGSQGSEQRAPAPAGAAQAGAIERVVDGDTVIAQLGSGATERVRLIGIDTPESVKPGTPVQCFALKASAYTKHLLTGRRVRLVLDAEPRDRYGRLLAYVYREPDGAFVNAQLVRDGYARTLTIAPNVAHARQFAQLARTARRGGRGLWGACGMG